MLDYVSSLLRNSRYFDSKGLPNTADGDVTASVFAKEEVRLGDVDKKNSVERIDFSTEDIASFISIQKVYSWGKLRQSSLQSSIFGRSGVLD
jgi:hypothetical protein